MSIKQILLASVMAVAGLAQADVLYWQVDNPKIYDWDGKSDVADRANPVAPWTSARLVDSSGTAYALYYEDANGVLQSLGATSVSIDSWSNDDDDNDGGTSNNGVVYPLYADIGTSASGKSFMIELMNSSGNVAHSSSVGYDSLVTSGYVAVGSQLSTPSLYQAWNGGTFTIPEPTSGLLFLVGGSLLALRRRKRA